MQLKKLYKYLISIILLIYISYYTSINLGFYFDISKIEKKSDLLLCLGGGKGERIKKTIKIYKKYSSYNPQILLTESNNTLLEKKILLLKNANIPINNITTINTVYNTYSELKEAYKIMINKNYKSVNIISDEPHSRRIQILINNFIFNKKDTISYTIVGSNVQWWNKKYYYKNKKRAIYFIVHETIKIIHNLTYYYYIDIFNIELNNKINEENEKKFIKKINNIINYILSF